MNMSIEIRERHDINQMFWYTTRESWVVYTPRCIVAGLIENKEKTSDKYIPNKKMQK